MGECSSIVIRRRSGITEAKEGKLSKHIVGARNSRISFQDAHILKPIPDHNLYQITTGVANVSDINEILDKILIKRVPGTDGHEIVKNYIIERMQQYGWHIERDAFEDDTPNMGRIKFENIIATLNPSAERFLLLAAHYDSKYVKEFDFLGATDSAVPCAMLINLASTLHNYLKQNRGEASPAVSLKIVFFDGEEAFHQWTETDSIYGARHLAAKWQSEGFLPKIVSQRQTSQRAFITGGFVYRTFSCCWTYSAPRRHSSTATSRRRTHGMGSSQGPRDG